MKGRALWIAFIILGLSFFTPLCEEDTTVASGENQPPVAVGGNITVVEPGETVFLSASGSYDPDPEGKIVYYEWDFEGDGEFEWNSTENGNTEYTYENEGAYNATLRVTDDENATAEDIFYVLVLKDDDDDETDLDRIRAVLMVVGVLEIVAGVGITVFALWLKRKLYDTL